MEDINIYPDKIITKEFLFNTLSIFKEWPKAMGEYIQYANYVGNISDEDMNSLDQMVNRADLSRILLIIIDNNESTRTSRR